MKIEDVVAFDGQDAAAMLVVIVVLTAIFIWIDIYYSNKLDEEYHESKKR
jgi:ABC-type Fe3+ transport system permease subunit